MKKQTAYVFVLLLLAMALSGCGMQKVSVDSMSIDMGHNQEPLDPELAKDAYPRGDQPLTAQERTALFSEGEIKFNDSSFAQAKIKDQFLYLVRDVRGSLKTWFKRAESYLPHAKKVFREKGLPEELAYLAFIESGYNTRAYSKSGAAGVWQFMPFTGRKYGLKVDWWVDERRDAYKAAHSAATYLKYLHSLFNDWSLAIAAYNAGEGKVGRACKATGAKNFFELAQRNHKLSHKKQLREETLKYVPRFAAMVKIVRNHELLGFEGIKLNKAPKLAKVDIPGGINLVYFSEAAGMSWAEFQRHNPAFRREATPPGRTSVVYMPPSKTAGLKKHLRDPKSKAYQGYHKYVVKRGDSWSKIAGRYNTDVSTLKSVNGKSSDTLRIGQRVMVPVQSDKKTARRSRRPAKKRTAAKAAPRKQPKAVTSYIEGYKVRPGDTLYSMAKRHNTTVSALMKANSMKSPLELYTGKIMRIPQHSGGDKIVRKDAVKKKTTAKSVKKHQTSAKTAAKAKRYKVRNGDTIWSIARQFKISPHKLMKWNNLSMSSVIQPGDNLHVYLD